MSGRSGSSDRPGRVTRLCVARESTSTRNFVAVPAVVLAEQALSRRHVRPAWATLAAWGYLQYRLCGRYRTARGGGGPGLSNPPVSLVTTGPHALSRNPMYLGHLIFLAALTVGTGSPLALAYTAWSLAWFDRRAAGDESRLAEHFGEEYLRYRERVARWAPRPMGL
ncbi:MAG: isoprenylcysteine carboxylmethyltransferase family protein [Acidobacteriota bacterium]|nr:isoprenylcysteine carboxylmethyltransferase family protein [Acidobacteriota bacterium]